MVRKKVWFEVPTLVDMLLVSFFEIGAARWRCMGVTLGLSH